jgi:hypothetical protein
MVRAALLLLMLEAVTTNLVSTISLKRSTQNLQLSTSWAGRLPHLMAQSGHSSGNSGNGRWRSSDGNPSAIQLTTVKQRIPILPSAGSNKRLFAADVERGGWRFYNY